MDLKNLIEVKVIQVSGLSSLMLFYKQTKKTDAPVDHQSGSWQHSSMNHVGKSTFNIEEVCMFNCGAESAVLPPW